MKKYGCFQIFLILLFISVIIAIVQIVIFFSSPEKRTITFALVQLNQIEREYDQLTASINYIDMEDARRSLTYTDSMLRKIQAINVSKCPADFQKYFREHIRLFADVAQGFHELFRHATAVRNATSPAQKSLAEQRVNDYFEVVDQRKLKYLASAMRLNDCAASYGLRIKQRVPNGYTREQLSKISLDDIPSPALDLSGMRTSFSPRQPPSPQVLSLDDRALEIQPIYDGIYKRIAKLLVWGNDPDISAAQRKEAAEKTIAYIERKRNDSLPGDVKAMLDRLNKSLNSYSKAQEKQLQMEDSFFSVREVHKTEEEENCLRTLRNNMSHFDTVVKRYGCHTFVLPAP